MMLNILTILPFGNEEPPPEAPNGGHLDWKGDCWDCQCGDCDCSTTAAANNLARADNAHMPATQW